MPEGILIFIKNITFFKSMAYSFYAFWTNQDIHHKFINYFILIGSLGYIYENNFRTPLNTLYKLDLIYTLITLRKSRPQAFQA